MTYNKTRPLLLLGGTSLSSLPGWLSLLGPDDGSSAPESSLGKILPVPPLHHHGLHAVETPPGTGSHGGRHQGFVGLVATLGSLGCQNKTVKRRGMRREIQKSIRWLNLPLVVSSSADVHRLVVDKSVVSLGVPVGQVAGLRREGLLHSSLLQQEAAVVTDDSPGNIRGNHLGFYTL